MSENEGISQQQQTVEDADEEEVSDRRIHRLKGILSIMAMLICPLIVFHPITILLSQWLVVDSGFNASFLFLPSLLGLYLARFPGRRCTTATGFPFW